MQLLHVETLVYGTYDQAKKNIIFGFLSKLNFFIWQGQGDNVLNTVYLFLSFFVKKSCFYEIP